MFGSTGEPPASVGSRGPSWAARIQVSEAEDVPRAPAPQGLWEYSPSKARRGGGAAPRPPRLAESIERAFGVQPLTSRLDLQDLVETGVRHQLHHMAVDLRHA